MKHTFFQFETLGQNAFTCPVVNISWITVDWDRFTSVMEPYRFSEVSKEVNVVKIDLKEQVKKYGYIIEDNTVNWWKKQGSLAIERIKPSDEDVSLNRGMLEFLYELPEKNKGLIWSRGNNFHNVIADRIIRNLKIDTDKFGYWNARDIRTFIDTKFEFKTRNDFCPFESEAKWASVYNQFENGHKVAAEVMRFQTIARAEKDMDIISS